MKVQYTMTMDVEILSRFNSALQRNGESADDVLKKFMLSYAAKSFSISQNEYVALTENLLQKYRESKVGRLADEVLRKVLETGVVASWEILEMQKTSSSKYMERYQIAFGAYSKENFNLTFPLLLESEKFYLDSGNRFYKNPLRIGSETFYLCSQWYPEKNREPLENWIRRHLLSWFEKASDSEKIAMKNWILSANARD